MGLITKEVSEEKFTGTVHVLTCDVTGKKLANILVQKSNDDLPTPIYINVKATSPFAPAAHSGVHKIGGILSYGPIDRSESNSPTQIRDMEVDERNNEIYATLIIKEVGE